MAKKIEDLQLQVSTRSLLTELQGACTRLIFRLLFGLTVWILDI